MTSVGWSLAERIGRRDRYVILAVAMAVLAAVGWTMWRAHGAHGQLLAAPDSASFDARSVFGASVLWLVMMAAMMLPVVFPWLTAYAAANRSQAPSGASSVAAFAGGYALVWGVVSVAAAVAQITLQHGALLHQGAVTSRAGGMLLVVAGLYELTPTKAACLEHCRSPMAFFLTSWRPGRLGALHMGMRHGLFCAGCCWALMALMFVLGVMNLIWMAALTTIVVVEKLAPRGLMFSRFLGGALMLWGAWKLAA